MRADNLLDTNLLIRFLTADDPKKALKVRKLLSQGKQFFIPDIVFAEIAWVLNTVYEVNREDIYIKLKSLLNFNTIKCDKILILLTLENYHNYPFLSFVDSYLAALVKSKQSRSFYSWDKSFDKVSDLKRLEP